MPSRRPSTARPTRSQIGASISAYVDVHIQGGPLVTVLMADSSGLTRRWGPTREAAVQQWIGLLAGAVARRTTAGATALRSHHGD